ncbi:7096_t:CDS:2, partial [Dentiscutata heterogama]
MTTKWSLSNEFSTIYNPSSVWSYGYSKSLLGHFSYLIIQIKIRKQLPFWSTPSNMTYNSHSVGMHPDDLVGTPSVVRFTAPKDGNYTLSLKFTHVDDHVNNSRRTGVYIMHNDRDSLWQEELVGLGASKSYNSPDGGINIKTNDTIDFIVGQSLIGNVFENINFVTTLVAADINLENDISNSITYIKSTFNVDLCFVLDCTNSMDEHIAAAKDHILRVSNYVKNFNSDVKLWFGFCGYRDHCDGRNRLQILDFTNSHEEFKLYITKVKAKGGKDIPEDVLGGLNAAITSMTWKNGTRVLIHIGDAPPHGRRFNKEMDEYPKGDPYGLTAEKVFEKMQSKNILYHFGKINDSTDVMINIFRKIIGEFPVFDLKTTGDDNPGILLNKFCEATCSVIISSVLLTTTVRNTENFYSLQRKRLQINPLEPDWATLSENSGELLYYTLPKSLDEIKDKYFFINSNFTTQHISFKLAPQPFSVGAERYAYFAIHTDSEQNEKLVIKKYHDDKPDSKKRYLESVEASNIAQFLSSEFNSAAEQNGIKWKVKFIDANILCSKSDSGTLYYSIENYFSNAKFQRFNTNSGIITDFHSALEAFAHFTYQYTKGYLVVYDLQGVNLDKNKEFLLTDPAIHCIDVSRFGVTNF